MKRPFFHLTSLLLLLFTCSLTAQDSHFNARSFNVKSIQDPISIDAILDEETWRSSEVLSNFYMQQPTDGEPAPMKTEVQVAFSETHLFIAAKIYDDPNYVVNSLKRDQFGNDDSFGVIIDPTNQKSYGFGFGVNPFGAQTEALISPNNVDETWDNKWESSTKTHEDHWIVEMAIPFKTLRFKSSNNTWGINFFRLEPGSNEGYVWSPIPRQFDIFDVGYLGQMQWENPPKAQGKNFALIPYISVISDKDHDNEENSGTKVTVGGDAKIAISSGLNLDLTLNPDFSQVEVDQQVTNLDRFNIFFPERRQFFVENADIFNAYGQFANQPFYSRRIGLDPQGRTVPILAGIRLTGNVNEKLRIGTFSMQTKESDSNPGQNYSAFTFQHRIGARSNIKGLFLNRQAFNDTKAISGQYGRNAGAELNLRTKDGIWGGQAGYIHSFKEGISDENKHFYSRFDYSGQKFRTFLFVQNLGKDYYADMGFNARISNWDPINQEIVRIGYTQIGNMIDYYIYPKNSDKVDFHWTGLENFIVINRGTGLNDWYTRLRHFISFKNSSELKFRLNNNYVDLIFPFALTETPLPVKEYNMTEFNVQYDSDQRKSFTYGIFAVYGQFYEGTKATYVLDLNYRFRPWVTVGVAFEQNNIRMPEPYGNLDLTNTNARVEVSFTNSIFWTTFLQYNTQNENFNVNSRLQWRYAPMSDIYLVYTDNYLVDNMFGPKSKTLALKVNYWLGF